MKLKVGMYVRTKHNGIGKIVEYINDPTHYFFKCYKLDRNCSNCEEYITKADVIEEPSYNIIDLIDVGDIIAYKRDGEIFFAEIWGEENTRFICHLGEDIDLEDVNILSILTKKQFKENSYNL